MLARYLAAAAAVFALGGSARAATFIDTNVHATCVTSCFDDTQTYSQIFGLGAFSGPVQIGGFSFDRRLLGADHQTSVFHVTFWNAAGQQVGDLGHFMVGSLAGDELVLHGQAFDFDPSSGPLTMRLQIDNSGGGVGGGGFGFSASGGSDDPSDDGAGVQSFSALSFAPSIAAIVPEPSAWTLMLLGLACGGALLRAQPRRQGLPATA